VTRDGSRALVSCSVLIIAVGIARVWLQPASAQPVDARSRVASTQMSMPMLSGYEMPPGISAPEYGGQLPPAREHGLAHRLRQYPAIYLATRKQRAAAERLRRQLFASAMQWANPHVAAAAGFDIRRPHRRRGERRVMWFHSENRSWHATRDGSLQSSRPDTLIYADLPGRPLKLVGVMISMPRGVRGPTPGGPITRWHYHLVCVSESKRGLAPRRDGSCPAGSRLGVGSEMMHVWFTRDLRSAYAIHAPWPELCAGHLLTAAACASGKRFTGM
jgi:hypothetical protein